MFYYVLVTLPQGGHVEDHANARLLNVTHLEHNFKTDTA